VRVEKQQKQVKNDIARILYQYIKTGGGGYQPIKMLFKNANTITCPKL
jgi:hypothetical protein